MLDSVERQWDPPRKDREGNPKILGICFAAAERFAWIGSFMV